MEMFHKAKTVRLRGHHHDKYLLAEDDEESVTQDRNGSSRNARWTVEVAAAAVRLKSCYGKYLTASNQPFLLGMTGCKVLQTLSTSSRLESSVEWVPVVDSGRRVKLMTRYGNFLRANGGLPPWRNSVTHDVPQRTSTQDWVLWEIDVLDIETDESLRHSSPASPPAGRALPSRFSRQESTDSEMCTPPKMEGRKIYYTVADGGGDPAEGVAGEELCLNFKGNGVQELAAKLEQETGLEDVIVCSRSALNGKLFPLLLQLPPNNATMHVVVVPSASKVAKDLLEH